MFINRITFKNVYKEYPCFEGSVSVIKDCSISFVKGMTYSIMGISGSGKSTLLHLLASFDVPSSGDIFFNDCARATLSDVEVSFLRNKRLGFVFQDSYLLEELTVRENIMLKHLIDGARLSVEVEERVKKILFSLGLQEKADSYPYQLSGGQRQRVAIGRALWYDPDFFIADEPTGHLDSKNAHIIIELLITLQKTTGMGLIISTHDPHIAERMEKKYVVANYTIQDY